MNNFFHKCLFGIFLSLIVSIFPYSGLLANSYQAISISCELRGGAPDSLLLYEWDGAGLTVAAITTGTSGNYKFGKLKLPVGIYFIGTSRKQYKPIVLGTEPSIKLTGHVDSLSNGTIVGSSMNDLYFSLMGQMNLINNKFQGLIRQMRTHANAPDKQATLIPEFAEVDSMRLVLLEKAKNIHPFFKHIVAVQTYLSFQHNNNGRYANEIEYFANEYFQFTDFDHPDYDFIPQLFDASKSFAFTLARAGMNPEGQKNAVSKNLKKITTGTTRYKAFLLGATVGFLNAKSTENFVHFGDLFMEVFPEADNKLISQIKSQLDKARKLMIGSPAPEISEPTPDGEVFNLSSLQGKYVLIDFWASWCGPCRRENPNVVKMYQRYHDKGFEILSVSLDNDRNRWLQAIEKDQMTWYHVSELKKWKGQAAREYGVTGIPFTLLVDPEGKILAKNLRGVSLEAKLSEIFGE